MTRHLSAGLVGLALGFLALADAGLAQQDRSAEFARISVAATLTGDRQAAIVAALRGLPSDPRDEDFETFGAAHDALFRAVASRIVRVDRSGFQHYAVNATGDRAVIGPANGPEDGSGQAPPYVLLDPRDGTEIAELVTWDVPMSLVYGPGLPPAFSPKGDLVALWDMDEGAALLFDTADGRPHPSLPGGGQPGGLIGFSPDGSRLAAAAGDALLVWDLATRERLASPWPGSLPLGSSAAWAADGSLVVARPEFANYEIVAVSLDRYAESGPEGAVRFEVSGPALDLLASPAGQELLVLVGDHQFVANPATGTALRIGPAGDSFWRFTRGGKAVATMVASGMMASLLNRGPRTFDLRVKSLAGADLAAERRDWVVFDQHPVAPDGATLGLGAVRPYSYRGQDVPEGRALYDAVWLDLPQAIRDEIDADRVAR
ncbi:hypothetical protein [Maliponia aquimaris]|uniref:hypothetical protein n=1 Tax=Maliponia aquimaris TaxID=1673631 RepID=UPI000B8A7D9A|nr:hypothetical protein [Maliponia aquimaris]